MIALWMAVSAAWAGGFEVTPQGAEVGGLAHAGTAVPARAESAWFNPAALADGGGFRVGLGLTLASSRITAQGPDPNDAWTTQTISPLGTPPFLYLAYSRADWSVSLSGNVPFGGGVVWPEGWQGRHTALASQPQFFRVGGAFAYRVGMVRLGASVHVDTGSLLLRRATDHVSEDGEVTTSLRGTGVGGGGYVLVTPGEHASIGFTYKSRTSLPLSGEVDFDVPAVFAASLPDQGVQAAWTLPDRIALGFAWSEEAWMATVEASLTLWSVNDELVLDFEDDATADSVIVNGWRPTAAIRAAAEGRVHPYLRVRGGLEVDGIPGAPAPDALLSPSSPDSTRLGVAVGLSVDPHELVSVHGWVQPLLLLERRSGSSFAASYQGYAVLGGLAVSVQVPNKPRSAPLKGSIRRHETPVAPPTEPKPASDPDAPFDPWDKPEP